MDYTVAGFWATAVGTLLTLGAISFALLQLHRTQTATTAARRAIDEIKGKLGALDAISEVARCSTALRETQRHLLNSAWSSSVDSYSAVSEAITRIIELVPDLKIHDKKRLGMFKDEIRAMSEHLDKQKDGEKIEDIAKQRARLREMEEVLTRVAISMERMV